MYSKPMLKDSDGDNIYDLYDYAPLDTMSDDKDKSLHYQHLGMRLDKVRNCGEKFHMYDLIREC